MAAAGANIHFALGHSIDALTDGLDRSSKAVDKAIDRAIRKVMKWGRREVLLTIARSSGLKQTAFKSRVTDTYYKNNRYGRIWVGLNPVAAELAGTPSQDSGGVSVAGHRFDQAFVATIYRRQGGVWRRKFRGAGSAQRGAEGPLRGRFPVEHLSIEIQGVATADIERLQPRLLARFETLLDQELHFALNVEAN